MNIRRVKINSLTEPELQVFRDLCNFSDEELAYFNLRAKDKTNTYIAFQMHISESKVSKLAKRVQNKILRIV